MVFSGKLGERFLALMLENTAHFANVFSRKLEVTIE